MLLRVVWFVTCSMMNVLGTLSLSLMSQPQNVKNIGNNTSQIRTCESTLASYSHNDHMFQ